MSIVRHHHETDDTVIANGTIRDPGLSWRATGMHAYLLSLPDGWRINGRDLSRRKTDGYDAVLATLRELERAGYVRRGRERDARGQLREYVDVFEARQAVPAHEGETGSPGPGAPAPGAPAPVPPATVGPTLGSTYQGRTENKYQEQVPNTTDDGGAPDPVTSAEATEGKGQDPGASIMKDWSDVPPGDLPPPPGSGNGAIPDDPVFGALIKEYRSSSAQAAVSGFLMGRRLVRAREAAVWSRKHPRNRSGARPLRGRRRLPGVRGGGTRPRHGRSRSLDAGPPRVRGVWGVLRAEVACIWTIRG